MDTTPFRRSNAAAAPLCQRILDFTGVNFPAIEISESVAILLYRLVLDMKERASEFAACTWNGAYKLLASLSCGKIVHEAEVEARAKRLQVKILRKASRSHPLGLDVALRFRVSKRGQEATITGRASRPKCICCADGTRSRSTLSSAARRRRAARRKRRAQHCHCCRHSHRRARRSRLGAPRRRLAHPEMNRSAYLRALRQFSTRRCRRGAAGAARVDGAGSRRRAGARGCD